LRPYYNLADPEGKTQLLLGYPPRERYVCFACGRKLVCMLKRLNAAETQLIGMAFFRALLL
jgi:hypothetical protein